MAFDPYYNNVSLLLPMEGANNSTSFVDYSPSPKTVTANGDAKISTAQSKWGAGSGLFSGDSYLSVATLPALVIGTSSFAIEGWFLPNASGPRFVYANGVNTTGGILLSVSTNEIRFRVNEVNDLVYSAAISSSVFSHIAIGRSESGRFIYLNGSLVASDSLSFNQTDNNSVQIGAVGVVDSSYRYSGYIQDFRFTKIARYTADFTPPGALHRVAIGGTVTVYGNGGAQQVVIRDVATRQLAAIATPDETTGAWTASVPESDYDITYFAPDCQPICHGPYTITA